MTWIPSGFMLYGGAVPLGFPSIKAVIHTMYGTSLPSSHETMPYIYPLVQICHKNTCHPRPYMSQHACQRSCPQKCSCCMHSRAHVSPSSRYPEIPCRYVARLGTPWHPLADMSHGNGVTRVGRVLARLREPAPLVSVSDTQPRESANSTPCSTCSTPEPTFSISHSLLRKMFHFPWNRWNKKK